MGAEDSSAGGNTLQSSSLLLRETFAGEQKEDVLLGQQEVVPQEGESGQQSQSTLQRTLARTLVTDGARYRFASVGPDQPARRPRVAGNSANQPDVAGQYPCASEWCDR